MNRNKLTVAFVRKATKPGRYGDGMGLQLFITPTGGKSWVQRLVIQGVRRDLGLGPVDRVSLGEARKIAFENRNVARSGGDPRTAANPAVPTFREAVEAVLAIQRGAWRDSRKSEGQWRASLRDYAMKRLGNMPVDSIRSADVLAVLWPIWNTKRETARRVKQRISMVMRWAMAEGHRESNPADAIGAALPKVGPTRKHQRALPHSEVAGAIATVRASKAWPMTQLALEFMVLTAARSGEVRAAMWSEIDLDGATWTVPGDRMKAGREHRVPLSGRAMAILAEARELSDASDLLFPSVTGRVMSNATIGKLLRERGIDAVPHGFRSSFRDWAGDTGKPRELAEMALAHVVKGVEGAYARSDLFVRRRRLMESWAIYLAVRPVGTVVPLRA